MNDAYSRLTRRVAEALAVILFVIVLGVQTLNILFRYTQVVPPWEWVEEFSKYALIWMFFLLWHLSDRQRSHFVVDFLVAKFSSTTRRWFDAFEHLIAIIFAGLTVWSSVGFVSASMGYSTQSVRWLPMGIVYLIIPVGIFLVLVERLRLLIATLRGIR